MSTNSMSDLESILNSSRMTSELEVFLAISALSFIPVLLITVTTFTRNIVVLSILRHALGLQQSPPNLVLIILSLFLAIFTMSPVLNTVYDDGLRPYFNEESNVTESIDKGWRPIKAFLVSQTHESDIKMVYKLANEPLPNTVEDLDGFKLIPSFLLSELKTAFKIGFTIYLPFLLIDIVVAAVLMSLGMIMVPPITISLPLKIMLFVVVDGWLLVAQALISSAS